MRGVEELLGVGGSTAALALRLGLHGLAGQLRAARSLGGDDPGAGACEALLAEIDGLLSGVRLPAPPPPRPGTPSAPMVDLTRVRQAVREDGEMAALYTAGAWPEDDCEFWTAAQLLGLRVVPSRRAVWQQVLAKAAGTVNRSHVHRLPLSGGEVIFPGVGDGGCRGWQADLLAPLDPRLGEVSAGSERTLAGVVTVCLLLLDTDRCLHHALYGLFMFGVKPFDDLERSGYAAELVSRWNQSRAATDPVERLLARIALDEAIHSLLYRPAAARDSWWGQVQYQARATLDEAVEAARGAGHDVFTQALWGPYKGVRASSDRDVQVDAGPVPPGEVLACLRVAARIDGRVYPGRVLYRSAGG